MRKTILIFVALIASLKAITLPDNFDLRTQYPNCESIKEIRSYSLSTAALAAIETMDDRICINQANQQDFLSKIYSIVVLYAKE
jgi:hypothetical protein